MKHLPVCLTWRGRLLLAETIAVLFGCASTESSTGDGGVPIDSVAARRDSAAEGGEFCPPGPPLGAGDALGLCFPACSTSEDCSSLMDLGDGCTTGHGCFIPLSSGPLACRSFCLCKDNLSGPPPVPIACRDGGS
jgi:hypothetical protein